MLVPCLRRRLVLTVPLVFVAALLLMEPARSDQEAGTAIPAETLLEVMEQHGFLEVIRRRWLFANVN